MPKIAYVEKRFTQSSQAIIDTANSIIAEYAAQGFDLTVRQLGYQFVARDLMPNTTRDHKRLASIINDARLAGLIDWDAIQDRTRFLRTLSHWEGPQAMLRAVVPQYRRDRWRNQPRRPEVWSEKDALIGVIADVCEELDVPYFSCRGYTSQTAMWASGRRALRWIDGDQVPIILHLGDHDPSGIDMTRDMQDRLQMFTSGIEVRRLALNMDQVQQYAPPPNPAKTTDSRYISYITLYGEDSWELDALDPPVIIALIREAVETLRNDAAYQEVLAVELPERDQLQAVADRWEDVTAFLEDTNHAS